MRSAQAALLQYNRTTAALETNGHGHWFPRYLFSNSFFYVFTFFFVLSSPRIYSFSLIFPSSFSFVFLSSHLASSHPILPHLLLHSFSSLLKIVDFTFFLFFTSYGSHRPPELRHQHPLRRLS